MAIPITVPRLGWSMEEGTFVGWLKQDGDRVLPGDLLFVLESDKASEEIAAVDEGILRIGNDGAQAGAKVKVGDVIGYLAGEGEAMVTGPTVREGSRSAPSLTVGPVSSSCHAAPSPPRGEGSKSVSPRARRVARELGVDPASLHGTGRNGRVRERDVRAAAQHLAGRLIPHTPLRRAIATRMVAGVTQAAPVTLTTQADAEHLVALRRARPALSYTAVLVKLAADALRLHPLLQAQWRDDGLFVPDRIDVAVAVDTEAGLLAPVVRDADRLDFDEIAGHLGKLAEAARAGRLTAEQMRDATFTVTNLGMFGIDAFTPIITLPQCAVLGVGRIDRGRVTLSLTFDHRVVDGAPAARYLDTVRHGVERTLRGALHGD